MKSLDVVTSARAKAKLLSIPSGFYGGIAGSIWGQRIIKDENKNKT